MSSLKEAFTGLDSEQSKFFISQQIKYNEVEPRRFQQNAVQGNLGPSITLKTLGELSSYDPYTQKITQPISGAGMGQLLQGQPDVTKEETECRNYIGINGIEQLIRDTADNPNNPVRCGWRYQKSPGLMPIVAQGALGTINGPLNANAPEDKLGNGVSWIWNLENAKKIMLRDLAGALPTGASLSVLNSIGAGDYAGRLGWCGTNGTNGKMIPINADGKPTYGQDSTLGCPPGQLYTSAASVPAASSSQNAVQASQAASIQPLLDCATAGNSVSLTRDCFLQAIKNSQCGADGTLYQSLQLANGADSRWDSYLNNQPSFQAYQSRQGANGITDSLFQKNQGKWETALADIARMQKALTSSSDPYVKVSAKDLCLQSGYFDSYDFCKDITDTTDINSVDLQCIKSHWQEQNGKPAGTAYPTSKTFDRVLGSIKTWIDYKNAVAKLKANTSSSDPLLQRQSMNAFFGVRVGTRAFSPKTVNTGNIEPTPPCFDYGNPSGDNRIRVYSQDECVNKLDGKYASSGECIKKEGGSYSWDCRYLNANESANTLVLWLDANDGSTLVIDGNGGVKNWNDKSGKGNNVTQMSVGNRPYYKGGNLPCIEFNGNSSFLPLPNSSSLVKSFFTIFIVEQRTSPKDYNCLFGGADYGVNINLVAGYRSNTGTMMAFWGNDLDNTAGVEAYRENEPYKMWCFHYGSSGRAIYINGKKVISDRNGQNLTSWNGGSIGLYAGSFYQGRITEVLIYNPSLDGNEKRQKIEGYLASKWGLQSQLDGSHPYKNVSP